MIFVLEKQVIEEKLGCGIHWYRYLQLQHLSCSALVSSAMSLQKLPFELLLLKGRPGHRGVLSRIYKVLFEAGSAQVISYLKLWEKDGILLETELWNSIWLRVPFCSATVVLQRHTVKFLMRWYFPPAKLDYLHNWWHCTMIKHFWELIQGEIKCIMGINIPLTIRFCLFNIYFDGHLDMASSETMGIRLTVAKTVIALKWGDKTPPSLSIWQSKLMEHFVLGKLEFSRSDKCSTKSFWEFYSSLASDFGLFEQM